MEASASASSLPADLSALRSISIAAIDLVSVLLPESQLQFEDKVFSLPEKKEFLLGLIKLKSFGPLAGFLPSVYYQVSFLIVAPL